MTRAMWKGVLRFGKERIPVKLYAAVEERNIHFRLLHRKDQMPVTQAMVNPHTEEVVNQADTHRAFVTDQGEMVMLSEDDLAEAEPTPSRDIEVVRFLPQQAIDHRWYQRPYYLGPDDGTDLLYAALASALERSGREGLTRWVMRKKEYLGALRANSGYLMLVSLRYAEEVVAVEALEAPQGPKLAAKELAMAEQLVEMLTDRFEPRAYRDRYRERVEELIDTKARGGRIRHKPAPKRPPARDLTAALEASLKQERKRA